MEKTMNMIIINIIRMFGILLIVCGAAVLIVLRKKGKVVSYLSSSMLVFIGQAFANMQVFY